MILIKPSHEILTPINREFILKMIERAGRTCYKSEDKITEESASKFVRNILKRGHESVIEHYNITVKFICDRGVTHELVRHRLVAYSQESTRYCNYKEGVTFIIPLWFKVYSEGAYNDFDANTLKAESTAEACWVNHMLRCEKAYKFHIETGWSPQQARSVLPNALKTEIVTTANLREWRHILKLRTSNKAHPQIREIMIPLLEGLKSVLPEIFDELGEK